MSSHMDNNKPDLTNDQQVLTAAAGNPGPFISGQILEGMNYPLTAASAQLLNDRQDNEAKARGQS